VYVRKEGSIDIGMAHHSSVVYGVYSARQLILLCDSCRNTNGHLILNIIAILSFTNEYIQLQCYDKNSLAILANH